MERSPSRCSADADMDADTDTVESVLDELLDAVERRTAEAELEKTDEPPPSEEREGEREEQKQAEEEERGGGGGEGQGQGETVCMPCAASDAEEAVVCRVCHGESEPGRELFHPCRCAGTIKFVHQDCLEEWLRHSRQREKRCELCGEEFHFQNIYRQNAPLHLTLADLARELLPRTLSLLARSLRALLHLFLWLAVLPLFQAAYNRWVLCWLVHRDLSQCSPQLLADYRDWAAQPTTERLESLSQFWFTGLTHLCTIAILSVFAFEGVRFLMKVLIGFEKSHSLFLLEKDIERAVLCARELEELQRDALCALSRLCRRCAEIESLFLVSLSSALPSSERERDRERWHMFAEEVLSLELGWLRERDALQQTQRQRQRGLRVDRESISVHGSLDLCALAERDQRALAALSALLDMATAAARLPLLRQLCPHCEQLRRMLAQHAEMSCFDALDVSQRRAQLALLSSSAPLMLARPLRDFGADVQRGLDELHMQLLSDNAHTERETHTHIFGGAESGEEMERQREDDEYSHGRDKEGDPKREEELESAQRGSPREERREEESDSEGRKAAEGGEEEEEGEGEETQSSEEQRLRQDDDGEEEKEEDEDEGEEREEEAQPVEEEEEGEGEFEAQGEDPERARVEIEGNEGEQVEAGEGAAAAAQQEQDVLVLQLGVDKWLCAVLYVSLFALLSVVLPAMLGRYVARDSPQLSALLRTAREVLAALEQQEQHAVVAATLFDAAHAHTQQWSSAERVELYVLKIRAAAETIVGCVCVCTVLLVCYALYALKYARALLRDVSLSPRLLNDMFLLISSAAKVSLAICAHLLLLPAGLSAVLLRALWPAVRDLVDSDSLDLTSSAGAILCICCYFASLLLFAHTLFVAGELRKLLQPRWARFLPKESAEDERLFARLLVQRGTATRAWPTLLRDLVTESVAAFVCLLLCAVTPLRLGHWLSGTLSPLRIRSAVAGKVIAIDTQISAEMIMSHVLLPLLIDRLQYSASVRWLLRQTLSFFARLLDVQDALLYVEGDAQQAQREEDREIEEVVHENTFVRADSLFSAHVLSHDTRVALLLFSLCGVLALLSSWALHWPLLCGRRLFSAFSLSASDLFVFPVGVLLLWGVGVVGEYVLRDVWSSRENLLALLPVAWKWTVRVAQLGIAASLWLAVPPMLIGYSLQFLVIFPFRAAWNATHVFPFLQSWALGLILLKLFAKCVLNGVFGEIELRNQMEMALIRGFALFDFAHFINHIFRPIVVPLLDLVLVPFFASRVIGMFIESYLARTLLVRYSMHAWLAVQVIWSAAKAATLYLVRLHNEIRDERYLVATQLTNRQSAER